MRFDSDLLVSGTLVIPSGIITESLTVSGVPIPLAGGGGSGTITNINTTATGPSVTITGVGAIQTLTEGNVITISGIPLSGNARWDPFIPPASGSPYDDEFDQPAGSAPSVSKWTVFDPGSDILSITVEENPSRLLISQDFNDAFGGVYTERDASEGDFTAYTYVGVSTRTSRFQTLEHYAGLALIEDKDSPTTSNIFLGGVHWDKTSATTAGAVSFRVGVWEFDQYNDLTETLRSGELTHSDFTLGGGIFIRFRYTSSNNILKFDWSSDGISWHEVQTPDLDGASMTTFDAIGLLSRGGGDSLHHTSFSFFRFVEPESNLLGELPAGILAGAIEDPNFTEMTAVSGTFTESLTISGVPVSTGTGGGGSSSIDDINGISSGSVIVTGAGGVSTLTQGNTITVSGAVANIPFRGAAVATSSGIDVENSVLLIVPFDTTLYDTDGFHDEDVSHLRIPAGVTKAKFTCAIVWDDSSDNDSTDRLYAIDGYASPSDNTILQRVLLIREPSLAAGTADDTAQLYSSAPIPVEEGQYYRLRVRQRSGGTKTIPAQTGSQSFNTHFSIHVVEDDTGVSLTEFTAISGTFIESLTISGVPVSSGTSKDITSFLTPSIAGSGASSSFDQPFNNRSFVRKFVVTPTEGAVDDFGIELFHKNTFAAEDLEYEAVATGTYTDNFGWFHDDEDGTSQFHLRLTNNSSTASTFTVEFTSEVFA